MSAPEHPGQAESGKVDFAFGAPDRLAMACRVVRKHFLAGHRLTVYCSDGARLSRFDKLLWSFDDISFIPHVLANDPLAADTPVVLTAGEAGPGDWLLNLDDASPTWAPRFARILEIVSDDPEEKALARDRWRDYRAMGLTLVAHDLAAKPT